MSITFWLKKVRVPSDFSTGSYSSLENLEGRDLHNWDFVAKAHYYQIPNNSDERNNSDGWKDAWILIIAMTGIIALGVKSFNFNNSDGLNNSNEWKKPFNG